MRGLQAAGERWCYRRQPMADLPFQPVTPELSARLAASLDVEGKIPRALDALGPIAGRDVVLVDGGDVQGRALSDLGARVTIVPAAAGSSFAAGLPEASADAVISLWSAFRGPSAAGVAEADGILRPGGRLLVVHDYGRDDVSRLRGDLPEYGSWGRRDGWFLRNGFKIRVVHCFWTFDGLDEARDFLEAVFGEVAEPVCADLKRPRLSYNVAVYHRSRGGPGEVR